MKIESFWRLHSKNELVRAKIAQVHFCTFVSFNSVLSRESISQKTDRWKYLNLSYCCSHWFKYFASCKLTNNQVLVEWVTFVSLHQQDLFHTDTHSSRYSYKNLSDLGLEVLHFSLWYVLHILIKDLPPQFETPIFLQTLNHAWLILHF